MKNIRVFYLKIVNFLEVKVSIDLNRRVFVMCTKSYVPADCYFCTAIFVKGSMTTRVYKSDKNT